MDQLGNIDKKLRQIVDKLLLNGTLCDCPGLVHGKTGIAVFFFHYARYANNELFEEYAMDLIEEIKFQIHNNSPADYERGIAGIGAGIDYLIKNNFVDADKDIFRDFDERMYRAVMYDPWQDFSLYDGLSGYGRYWMIRLPSEKARACLLSITKNIEEKFLKISEHEKNDIYCFLHELQRKSGFTLCAKLLKRYYNQSEEIFHRLGDSSVGNITRKYQKNQYFNRNFQTPMQTSLYQLHDLEMEKRTSEIGLLNGYAGEGMLQLTSLDPNKLSWMNLL